MTLIIIDLNIGQTHTLIILVTNLKMIRYQNTKNFGIFTKMSNLLKNSIKIVLNFEVNLIKYQYFNTKRI